MKVCPHCGSVSLHEVTTYSDLSAVFICVRGHQFRHVNFQPHRYDPPLCYMDERDALFRVWDGPGPDPAEVRWLPRAIYCGPPAPYPMVPTPEEILMGAGLDPAIYGQG